MPNDTIPAAAPMLLRPPEAAKALGISLRKLQDMTKRGEVRVVRLGRNPRYDPADLRQVIERSKTA